MLFRSMPVTEVTVDGLSRPVDATSEDHGYKVSTLDLVVAGQSTMQITAQLAGTLDLTNGYHLVIRNAAAVNPLDTKLVVDEAIVEDLGAQAGVYVIGK